VKVPITRNDAAVGSEETRVSVGRIIKSHGLKGEVCVESFNDDPERLLSIRSIILEKRDGTVSPFEVEKARSLNSSVALKFRGVDDREAADSLRGSYLTVGLEELPRLSEDRYYIFELEGMDVLNPEGTRLGTVTRVEVYPANPVLVIVSESEEVLLPAVKEYILHVDTVKRHITVNIPEGLPTYPIGDKN